MNRIGNIGLFLLGLGVFLIGAVHLILLIRAHPHWHGSLCSPAQSIIRSSSPGIKPGKTIESLRKLNKEEKDTIKKDLEETARKLFMEEQLKLQKDSNCTLDFNDILREINNKVENADFQKLDEVQITERR